MTDAVARQVIGVDTGVRALEDADHLIHHLLDRLRLPEDTIACTHLLRSGTPHVALSFEVSADGVYERFRTLALSGELGTAAVAGQDRRHGPGELAEGAAEAADRHMCRRAGRVVTYPGAAGLVGIVPVGDLLTHSAIDRVTALGTDLQPGRDDLVHTRDHVRPEYRDGVVTLTVTPVAAGRYAPFELPNPTPCCADHP